MLKNDDMTHIDHANKQFRELVDNFMVTCGVTFKDVELEYNPKDSCYYLASQQRKNDWHEYHKKHACLVPIDKTWNLKNNQKALASMS